MILTAGAGRLSREDHPKKGPVVERGLRRSGVEDVGARGIGYGKDL